MHACIFTDLSIPMTLNHAIFLQLEQVHALYEDSEYKFKNGSCGKHIRSCICI